MNNKSLSSSPSTYPGPIYPNRVGIDKATHTPGPGLRLRVSSHTPCYGPETTNPTCLCGLTKSQKRAVSPQNRESLRSLSPHYEQGLPGRIMHAETPDISKSVPGQMGRNIFHIMARNTVFIVGGVHSTACHSGQLARGRWRRRDTSPDTREPLCFLSFSMVVGPPS
jgi:hypothetical protein